MRDCVSTSIFGITPAYAGNTNKIIEFVVLYRDHPRIRGEYKEVVTRERNHYGSPPHTRGILRSVAVLSESPRITPAYAGNTNPNKKTMVYVRDHPRIRGEYILIKA